MNRTASLLLIVLLILAACGTNSSADQLQMTANSNPSSDAVEESSQNGKGENKSLTLPSADSALITTEIEAAGPASVMIPTQTPSVPVADLISVSQVEDSMTTVEAVRELGP